MRTNVNHVGAQFETGDYTIKPGTSPHVPAALLKFWLRDLREPLIPFTLCEPAPPVRARSRRALTARCRRGRRPAGATDCASGRRAHRSRCSAPQGNDALAEMNGAHGEHGGEAGL